MGAGSVGCLVGGSLQHAGVPVTLVGRPRVLQALQAHGLRVTDCDGRDFHLPAATLSLHEAVPAGARPSLVLLCVKCGATETAARELALALPAGTPVVSLQNGIGNAVRAHAVAPGLQWLAGMVPYNMAEIGPGHFHRGTGGRLAMQAAPALEGWPAVFDRAGLGLDVHADLLPVQWGKLLLNLNNPVNALSGLPLRAELLEARHRRLFADLVDEALGVLVAAGITPARLTPLPWPRLVQVLRLPTWLFRVVASRMLRIDPLARSSMADDLALGRRTEIDALAGEVVRLAADLGLAAPRNAAIIERIRQREGMPKAPASAAP